MSADDKHVVTLKNGTNGHDLWDTSTTKLKEMLSKDWSNSFVAAAHSWDYIVPLPEPRELEAKKD